MQKCIKIEVMNEELSILQKELVDSTPMNPHGIFWLSQRLGKTKIIIDIIKRDKPKCILWVTPFKPLIEEIKSEFKTWAADKYLLNLTVSTYKSLPKRVGRYDMIILDECQFITKNNIQNLPFIRYRNIVAMSGTKVKDKKKLELLENLGLKVLQDYGLNKAVKNEYLSSYAVNIVQIPYIYEELKEYSKYNFAIQKHIIGTIETNLQEMKIVVNKDVEYKIHEKESKFPNSKLYVIFSNGFPTKTLGYIAVSKDGIIKGKITSLKDDKVYQIKDNLIMKQVPKFLYIQRMAKLGTSPLKTRVCKTLLNTQIKNQRNLIFASSIAQSNLISKNVFNSENKNTEILEKFKNFEINDLVLVNTGSVGSTYKKLDNLILTQIDSDNTGRSSQKFARTLLKQEEYIANIWILCVMDTADVVWVTNFVKSLQPKIINTINFEELCK